VRGRNEWTKTRRNAEFLTKREFRPTGTSRRYQAINQAINTGEEMMKKRMTGILKITGSLAVAGGMIVMAAMPAVAAAPNEAYAAGATGPISALPIGLATFPGTSPVTVLHANILGLLTTGVATDTAGPTSASSTVADVSATLTSLATLAATTVSSSCTFNTATGLVSGDATLTDGTVTVDHLPVTHLAAHPARNTTVSIPGVATITLNKHSTASDGTLTVTAIYVSLLGSTQTLSLGVSVCNAADLSPVPMLPSKVMPFALGGLGVLLIAGVSYGVTRRNRFAPAA
jgi:hypothetical protein